MGEPLRIGINTGNAVLARRDADGGLAGIAPDLARAFAARRSREPAFVVFEKASAMADAAETWDVAFLAADPAREGPIRFTAPYLELDAGYLVPSSSPLAYVGDVDTPGIRVGAQRAAAFELVLRRTLRAAALVPFPKQAEAVAALRAGTLHVVAGLRAVLLDLAGEDAALRVIPGRFGGVLQAIGVRSTQPELHAAAAAFVADVLRDGTVAALVTRHGAREVTVPPAPIG